MVRHWSHSGRIAFLAFVLVAGGITPARAQSDPLCPHIVACEYEAPAFTIQVVDQQTGQPLADVHAIAAWVVYGGPGRRGLMMAQSAVSGSDGRISFRAWGPVRSAVEGLLPGRDPVISLFRPGYRANLIYNATPLGRADTARVHAFQQAGDTFPLMPFQGNTPADTVAELWNAANPLDGGDVSRHDPEPIRLVYVGRWRRVMAEADRLPRVPQVERLLWDLDRTIRIFSTGGGQ